MKLLRVHACMVVQLRAIWKLAMRELVVRKLAAEGTSGAPDRLCEAAKHLTEGQTYVMAFAPLQQPAPSNEEIAAAMNAFASRMALHALQKDVKGRTSFGSYAAICKAIHVSCMHTRRWEPQLNSEFAWAVILNSLHQ